MAIGPRACPKFWDPPRPGSGQADADAACEPGELLPCPEGFVLTDDEAACIPFFEEGCGKMEISALGKGCLATGPNIQGMGPIRPADGECGPGEIPLAHGGCLLAGPRACPKLWAPDDDSDCEAGDVLPCAEGWVESGEGIYCEPVYDDCEFGERAVLGGGCKRVGPQEDECPDGQFPKAPDGAESVLYVDAESECTQECGSKGAPYPSLQEAVDEAEEGTAILVAAGDYSQGVLVDKPVNLSGLCAAGTIISGTVSHDEEGDGKTAGAGIEVMGTTGVSISNMGVTAPGIGIMLTGATDFALADMELAGSVGAAIIADESSQGSMSRLWIHDTLPGDGPGLEGTGIWVRANSTVTLTESLVETARFSGIYVEEKWSKLYVEESTIRSTQSNAGGFGGYGIRARLYATLSLTDVVLERNKMAGLLVREYSKATMDGCTIRDSTPAGQGEGGFGVYCMWAGELSLANTLIDGNSSAGVALEHSGTSLTADRIIIRDTLVAGNDDIAPGIIAATGASADISGSVVERSIAAGVSILDADTALYLRGSIVRETALDLQGEYGEGISIAGGATATVSTTIIEQNSSVGIAAAEPETEMLLQHSVVKDTLSGGIIAMGVGVVAEDGADVAVVDSVVERSSGAGLFISGLDTQAVIERSIVRNTLSAQGEAAVGVEVVQQGTCVILDSLLSDNAGYGLDLAEPGSVATMIGSTVRGTSTDYEEIVTAGIMASDGSRLSLSNCLLEANTGFGVAIWDAATEGTMAGCAIRDTAGSIPPNGAGCGVVATFDSFLTVSASLIEENMTSGLLVTYGTEAVLEGVVVRNTREGPYHVAGYGISVLMGAEAFISRSLVEQNTYAGIGIIDEYTRVSLQGTITRDNLVKKRIAVEPGLAPYFGGYGLFVLQGGHAELSHCLVQGNGTTGLHSLDPGTLLTVSDSAVLETTAASGLADDRELQVFGDGLYAGAGSEMKVSSCLVAHNERSGIYFYNGFGDVVDSVIFGNSSYGLAMEQCEQDVTYLDSGNTILGNATGQPAGQKAETTGSPEGLPPPPAPSLDLPE